MNDAKLFVPNEHDRQIPELRAFVRPFEKQPPPCIRHLTRSESGAWVFDWEASTIHAAVGHILSKEPEYHAPHQPGDVLAVAEEWWERSIQGLKRRRWEESTPVINQPAETMPPELARHHLTITAVQPVQVTKLTIQQLATIGYSQKLSPAARYKFATYWNATYSLPFEKEPWAWLYSVK